MKRSDKWYEHAPEEVKVSRDVMIQYEYCSE